MPKRSGQYSAYNFQALEIKQGCNFKMCSSIIQRVCVIDKHVYVGDS